MKRMIRLIICLLTVLVLLVSSACVTNEYTGAPPTLSPATEETTSEEETTEDAAEAAEADPEPVSGILGLFLGVQDYGNTETVNKANAASFRYRFFAEGRETTYRIGIGSGNDAWTGIVTKSTITKSNRDFTKVSITAIRKDSAVNVAYGN